jgi:transcriptional regulator with PAS, ATPase and Fis domain
MPLIIRHIVYLNILIINISNQQAGFFLMLNPETENKVLEFIVNSKEPLHSTDISKALGINRVTITKYLSVLYSKGLVSYRHVGMAKVWSAVENPIMFAFEVNDTNNHTLQAFNSLSDCISVLDRDMNIVWINKAMEKRHGSLRGAKGKKCFDVYHGKTIACKNCPVIKTFGEGKKTIAAIDKKDSVLEISTSPLKSPSGKLVGIIEIVRVLEKGKKESAVPRDRE